MNRYEIRMEVRRLLRDDTFPDEDINAAINRVISDINAMDRFNFHQASTDITLVSGTASYLYDQNWILADRGVIFAAGTSRQAQLAKYDGPQNALPDGFGLESGSVPRTYYIWGDYIFFDPKPNAVAAVDKVRLFYYKDLAALTTELQVPDFPTRYHNTVLAYGAAVQLSPMVELDNGVNYNNLTKLFERSVSNMRRNEDFELNVIKGLHKSNRWDLSSRWGRNKNSGVTYNV
jgi:hypothetical protein